MKSLNGIKIFFFLSILFLNACSISPTLKKEVPIIPVAQKTQMNVALLVPESTRSLMTSEVLSGPCISVHVEPTPFGVIFEETAVDTFAQVFDKVSLIRNMPPPAGYDAVIEATMSSIGRKGSCPISPSEYYVVKGNMRLIDVGGREIWRAPRDSQRSDFHMQRVFGMDAFTQEFGRRMSVSIATLLKEWAIDLTRWPELQKYARKQESPERVAFREPAPVQTDRLPPTRRDAFAVVIGIDYKGRQEIPTLGFASLDAQKVYDTLTDPRYGGVPKENAVLLLNEKATRNEIVGALRRIKTWDGFVYVYYSGHGAPKTKGDKFTDAFLVPHDVVVTDPEAMEETAIKVSYLQELVDASNAKGVMVALDACFSGGGKSIVPKGGKPLVGMMVASDLMKPKGEGRLVITSSAVNQQSWEDESELKGGIFSHYLLEGMRGKAGKNVWVKADELADYVSDNVPKAARRLKGIDQTPQMLGKGDFSVSRNWERAKVMDVEIARGKLKDAFERGIITAEQLSKAMDEMKSPKKSKTFEAYLEGKIDEKKFGELY
ncbi:MAG: caspase family protein [Nitrospirae bacterium]|nr:caspase family protein [Nitrospirota bacterium]